jgi:GT2 family glycosyltransferase
MTPGLSIGIQTRNRHDALRACLRSLGLVANLDPEILVFDDGSEPAASTIADAGTRVRFLRGPGPAAVGRNRLVREATCEFVLLLDDDTVILDGRAVSEALAAIAADPAIAVIAFAQAHADGTPWPAAMQPSPAGEPVVVNNFIGFAHLVRRSAFLELGGYREIFEYHGEEKELALRLLDAGRSILYLPAARIAHVTDPASRNAARYLRLVSRNDCLNSLYNDPPERVIWMVPARLVLYFRMRRGWKIHDPGGGWWVAREVVRCLPRVWRDRRPVARATLRRWRALRERPERYERPA